MHTATATLKSVSPYSQSRGHVTPRADKEGPDDWERRTWRERLHVDKDGRVYIPPMAFKNGLSETAKFLSMKIKGQGTKTYTKHFEAGVLVTDPVLLPLKKEDAEGEWLFLNSDGRRGGNKRVWKCMPVIREWEGNVAFHILDDTITESVFTEHLTEFGRFIGIGRFRPRNNGFYGRFDVVKVSWK